MVDENTPVSRADIEAKLTQIRTATDKQVETASDAGRGALIGGAALAIFVAFLLGRRRGRKGRAVVEIRRI